MAERDSQTEARRYVDRIIEMQRRRGYSPSVTPEEYEGAVVEATRAFQRLSRAAAKMVESAHHDEEA